MAKMERKIKLKFIFLPRIPYYFNNIYEYAQVKHGTITLRLLPKGTDVLSCVIPFKTCMYDDEMISFYKKIIFETEPMST